MKTATQKRSETAGNPVATLPERGSALTMEYKRTMAKVWEAVDAGLGDSVDLHFDDLHESVATRVIANLERHGYKVTKSTGRYTYPRHWVTALNISWA